LVFEDCLELVVVFIGFVCVGGEEFGLVDDFFDDCWYLVVVGVCIEE